MRIDVVSIFPAYLDALDVSLVGKARRDGVVDVRVHDLRDWTTDRHRTVDDTPFGGGAGMVMRPDIWGHALDDIFAAGPDGRDRMVLVLPTPAGERLTQRTVEDLATAGRLVIACGRYEGIDARVPERYDGRVTRTGTVEVREISLGDYVLNGGEVAALAIVEAVARLLPGVVGNPRSLIEESHGTAGLLEYPVYTKPAEWAGHAVPEVLLSGHHARVGRWRRDQALDRTALRRPDMIAALDPQSLDRADRSVLAEHGWYVPAGAGPAHVRIRSGEPDDAEALADLAATTFPLACPPELGREHIAAFIREHLSIERMTEYLTRPGQYRLIVAEASGAPVGYTLVILPGTPGAAPPADDVAELVTARPAAELSKCYLRPDYQGTGLAAALLSAAADDAANVDIGGEFLQVLWLGTHVGNRRAQAGYRKQGYVEVGRRRFQVGTEPMEDVLMVRHLGTPADEVRHTTASSDGHG